MILFGTILNSFNLKLSEEVILENEISPKLLCFIIGIFGSIILLFWQFYFIFPHFNELVLNKIILQNGDIDLIIRIITLLITINLMYFYCLYNLIENIGINLICILKAIQNIFIFIISYYLFYSKENFQFYYQEILISFILIIIGVIGYNSYSIYLEKDNSKK